MSSSSRFSGFYKLSLSERRAKIIEWLRGAVTTGATPTFLGEKSESELADVWQSGGLSPEMANQVVENVLGTYSLPLGLALNARMNGEDRLIPMVVEEPSVIAACSNACRMIRIGGGFTTSMKEALMIGQIELRDVPDTALGADTILAHEAEILDIASQAVPGLLRRGGGPKSLLVREIAKNHLVVHLFVDCSDAMGANLVNSAAEAVGPRLAELARGRMGLRILSNLTDRRMVTVECRLPATSLLGTDVGSSAGTQTQEELARLTALGIEEASLFAERDPYRAATHNKGIMNGVDSVVIATGNDYRAVEAGAHSYAAQSGTYRPLATWRSEGEELVGKLEMPLALGIVGGTLRVHPGARLALALTNARSADDLAQLAGCAGLASNLAALRALSTEGIQRGHMALHARSVAISAGATGDEVGAVARVIAESRNVTQIAAEEALKELRDSTLEAK